MRVGVVMTNYNNSRYTREAIASLRAAPRWEDVEVVVVDNRSTEAEVSALREMTAGIPNVTLILNPENVGYFRGLNVGVRHLRRAHPAIDYVVVGNNDLVFPPDLVETIAINRKAAVLGVGERADEVLERQGRRHCNHLATGDADIAGIALTEVQQVAEHLPLGRAKVTGDRPRILGVVDCFLDLVAKGLLAILAEQQGAHAAPQAGPAFVVTRGHQSLTA